MNAHEIVNLLLEADQPNADPSAGDRSGVYVFGPGLPDEGYSTPSVEKAIEEFRRFGIIPAEAKDSVTMMNSLVGMGYTFLLKKEPGQVEVIGKVPVRTTPDGAERAKQYLGLEDEQIVQYRTRPDGTSQQIDVKQVLTGSKELADKRKEERTVQTQQLGAIDPEKEKFKGPKHGVGYADPGEMMPLNAPAEIGVTIDMNQKDGIYVREVHPSSPAAQAGLQAGDVIVQAGKFARRDQKEPKAYALQTPNHFEYVMRIADLNYPVPFRVIRGDAEHWIPVQPILRKQKQSGPEMQITGAEAKAQQQVQQPQAQASPAKQMVLGLRQQRKKDPQRRLPLKPNQPTPARETGNPPANVSSLT